MNKLKYIFILLLVASCQKWQGEDLIDQVREEGTIQVNLLKTKAYTNAMREETLTTNLVYFVFSKNGALMKSGYISSDSGFSVTVPYGEMTLYVLANIDPSNFATVKNRLQFDNCQIKVYNGSPMNFVPMMGKETFTLNQSSKTIVITLERYISRLNITKIFNRLTGQLTGKDMLVKYAYLTNVQGGFVIGFRANSSHWVSKFGRPDKGNVTKDSRITSSDQLLSSGNTFRNISKTVVHNGDLNFTKPLFMYAFPNYTQSDVTGWSDKFTERFTRLVLVVEIDGLDYYYPVNLTNMRCNTAYDVSFVITKLGSDDPDTFDFVEMQDATIDFGGMDEGWDIEIEL